MIEGVFISIICGATFTATFLLANIADNIGKIRKLLETAAKPPLMVPPDFNPDHDLQRQLTTAWPFRGPVRPQPGPPKPPPDWQA